MATEEHEVQAKGRRRRRRAPESAPESAPPDAKRAGDTPVRNEARPGMLRLLLADLRKQQLPRPLEDEELALMEAEQELRHQLEQEAAGAHAMSPDHIEAMRRRYAADAT